MISTDSTRFYGYICVEELTKSFPDGDVTFKVDHTYPAWQVAALPRRERERYFKRNYARRGDVQVQS